MHIVSCNCQGDNISRNMTLQEDIIMRGYFTASGFYGLVGKIYVLFASEAEYYECMAEA